MGALFGKHSAAPTREQLGRGNTLVAGSVHDERIRAKLELKNTRDKVSKLKKKWILENDAGRASARKRIAEGRQDQALFFLKLIKLREAKLGKLDAQLLNLKLMILEIESAEQNAEIFKQLSSGNDLLHDVLDSSLSLEDIDDLMLDGAELEERVSAVGDALAGEVEGSDAADMDDDALMAELFGSDTEGAASAASGGAAADAVADAAAAQSVADQLRDAPSDAPLRVPVAPSDALEAESDERQMAMS